jgi:uncharacterized SAM-binding protein YcdF (DUF218 family)
MTELSDGLKAPPLPRTHLRRNAVIVPIAVLVALVAFAALELPAILHGVGHRWAVSDPLRHADAAVVLGGGFEMRPAAAAQLYKDGAVAQILVSTAGGDHPGIADPGNIDRQALIKLGVPASAIVEFGDHPANTYEEARALVEWAEQNRVRRIIVPTEIFPSRRVRWILRHELGKVGVDARVETLVPEFYNFDDWWERKSGLSDFESELIKYLYYRVRYWRS